MEPLQAKALAAQDAAWTDIAERKEQLEAVLKHGFATESDIVAVREVVTLVLAEIAYRQAEAVGDGQETGMHEKIKGVGR